MKDFIKETLESFKDSGTSHKIKLPPKVVTLPGWVRPGQISQAMFNMEKARELAKVFKENYPEVAEYLEDTAEALTGLPPHPAMSIRDWWECLEPAGLDTDTYKALTKYRKKRAPKGLKR